MLKFIKVTLREKFSDKNIDTIYNINIDNIQAFYTPLFVIGDAEYKTVIYLNGRTIHCVETVSQIMEMIND
jgi:hypothetical protein